MPVAARSDEHGSRLHPFPGVRPPRRGQWTAKAHQPRTALVTAAKVSNARMRGTQFSSCNPLLPFRMIAAPGCLVRYLRHKAATAVLPPASFTSPLVSVIVRSRDPASFPFCDGGIPRWSSINRPSGGIDSAHAGVRNKPRATNTAKHGWIQNATKWFDRDEVRSRGPRHPEDVDSTVQTVQHLSRR